MESHCSTTKYLFQVKKCLSENCLYCTSHPVRLPMDQFKKLSFVPLPLLDGEKYTPLLICMERLLTKKTVHPSQGAEADNRTWLAARSDVL